ncbi:tetratricopeptide repeat protein [Lentisphaera profundi]|uniref:Tetratricopeptide repeat protein n=1 Tax=Lentisphaera profundi TaxID=1658616 RepID=A0ABY7VVW6_9BACT|nr:tetratricopeptide repeat protein [Lentisphaera profundi]WDE96208.1 tetratricopeptide repeat protein [Lentisphaera profundi]
MSRSVQIQVFAIIAILVGTTYFSLKKQPIQKISDLWQTPNQQASTAFDNGDFGQAAKLYQDPMLKGQALFKNSQFEEAAISFNQDARADALFNSANSLLMMGKYGLAIKAYDRSLELNPEFSDAQFNKELALKRKKILDEAKNKMDEGTGGKLGADEIVFNDKPANNNEGEDTTTEEVMSEDEINELWLRRVQTKPADFLKIKFSYQLYKEAKDNE